MIYNQFNIYKGNRKVCDLLIISLIDIPFGLARKCNESSHESWKTVTGKYEVSDQEQESLNFMTSRWNNFRIK